MNKLCKMKNNWCWSCVGIFSFVCLCWNCCIFVVVYDEGQLILASHNDSSLICFCKDRFDNGNIWYDLSIVATAAVYSVLLCLFSVVINRFHFVVGVVDRCLLFSSHNGYSFFYLSFIARWQWWGRWYPSRSLIATAASGTYNCSISQIQSTPAYQRPLQCPSTMALVCQETWQQL